MIFSEARETPVKQITLSRCRDLGEKGFKESGKIAAGEKMAAYAGGLHVGCGIADHSASFSPENNLSGA